MHSNTLYRMWLLLVASSTSTHSSSLCCYYTLLSRWTLTLDCANCANWHSLSIKLTTHTHTRHSTWLSNRMKQLGARVNVSCSGKGWTAINRIVTMATAEASSGEGWLYSVTCINCSRISTTAFFSSFFNFFFISISRSSALNRDDSGNNAVYQFLSLSAHRSHFYLQSSSEKTVENIPMMPQCFMMQLGHVTLSIKSLPFCDICLQILP